MWHYQGGEFTSEDIGTFTGFVYEITNKQNGKKYIGKKLFVSRRKLKPLKGKKNARYKVVETDWQSYYGSSEEVKQLVEELGTENFHREILHLCRSKGEMTYYEAKFIFEKNALLTEDYYNGMLQCKIHHSHLNHLKKDENTS